ncbi:hypothetical protein AB0395_00735 [Streptosporangium sp. NPDC051023]|uniref:hypothetical protein n=1 Tax=Streptosporangium sp. NPDC051023 TaxID=3155410 RepID=UPI00344E16DA
MARCGGRHVVWLDGHELPRSPEDAAGVLGEVLDASPEEFHTVKDLVLLVDTAEFLGPLEPWLRRELIPALAADAVVVLAGRDRPSPAWRADPGWRELVGILQLGNLSRHEGRRLLELRGVPADERAAALDFTRGHPLALALVADVSAQRIFSETSAHEVMGTLLRSFVDTVPSPLHQQALEACAMVLATTEPLLAALLGLDDAAELFAWLRDLSIVEYGARGLFPHDLARDALGGELRWRDPDGCAQIRRRAEAYYRQRFAAGEPAVRQAVLLEFVYLHRDTSVLGPFVAGYPETGALSAGPPTRSELGTIVAWVREHEGEESARLCGAWLAEQPRSAVVVRGEAGEALGFYQLIDVGSGVADQAVPTGGETGRTRMVRFWMDGRTYQDPSPVQLFITLHLFRSFLTPACPDLTLLTFAEPDPWVTGCAHLDFHRVPDLDFEVGGRRFAVFGHDWRAVPPLAWISRLAERDSLIELSQGAERAPLSEHEFAEAVRSALRLYGRADGLRGSALLGTAMVTAGLGGEDDPSAPARELRAVLADTAERMAASPRDRRGYRALHHTFLQPAGTQGAAAELLGLPMTTFRRHLAAGEARFTEILWQRELDARHGRPS